MAVWKSKLTPAEVDVFEQIIDQVPGIVRGAFVGGLEKISVAQKFRFYVIDTASGEVFGTNDEANAVNTAGNEDFFVVDTSTNTWIQADGDKVAIKGRA